MQLAFYFDQSRCTGCYACTIACRDWHDIQDPSVHWRQIIEKESGSFPKLKLSYIALSCCHCEHPACAEACPAGAITKRSRDGIMEVDKEACLGRDACGRCHEACPYKVPRFGGETDAKMQMCTFCADRLEESKNPICVDACPMRALEWGPLDVLRKRRETTNTAEGFRHDQVTQPALVIKPRY
ncbi:MAG: 4Fe-4S dicluster domain-containing protein [Deltaproteobacteria bacterium]|nr:4Fe-4S dicluster domain-containing protein [Deltaproteobacteria bacterium]